MEIILAFCNYFLINNIVGQIIIKFFHIICSVIYKILHLSTYSRIDITLELIFSNFMY